MDSKDYDNKMFSLLNDPKTYKEINNDPTTIFMKRNNEIIQRWESQNYIPPNLAKELKIHNAQPPKIYGLPKLHKEGIPLRPIVACVQSPLNKLSNFLKTILQNIINKTDTYIKDSWDFKEKIRNKQLPNNYILVSFDVVSLYTNIPIPLALNIVEKNWEKIRKFTDIPLEEFLKAIELSLTSTYFIFKDKYFRQIDGCAMGCSISSVIAQMVLEEVEISIIQTLDIQLPFFFRYVDDCITALPINQCNAILNSFNNFHNKIQFTMELEKNNKISFLDLTLYHQNNNIKTEWYTKSTWSGRYLNYYSQHPLTQKKSVIYGLADRAIQLSDPPFRKNAIEKAKTTLIKNSYPKRLINSIFHSRLDTLLNPPIQQPTNNKKDSISYLSLPYIRGLSENFQKLFKNNKILIAHKGYNNLKKQFSKLKSKTPQNRITHSIYKIPCNNCPAVYIGQTSQYLQNRLNGHKYDKKNKTAITKHITETNHAFNYNGTKILQTQNHQAKREFLEMMYIKKEPNSINDRSDIQNLSIIYNHLIIDI